MNHPIPDHIRPGRFDNMPAKLSLTVVTQPAFEEGDLMAHLAVGMKYEAELDKAQSEDVGEVTYFIVGKFEGMVRKHYFDPEFLLRYFNIEQLPANPVEMVKPGDKL